MAMPQNLRLWSLLLIALSLAAYWLNSQPEQPQAVAGAGASQGGYLVIDLDADGIETFDVAAGKTFDFLGNGLQTGTGWPRADDGFLVFDRNNNGQIDDASELMGQQTSKRNGTLARDGFDALQDLDDNQDMLLDAQDAAFSQLQVWRDKNSDGLVQAGEMKSLAEHGVEVIELTATRVNHPTNSNRVTATAQMRVADRSFVAAFISHLPAAFSAFIQSWHALNSQPHQVANVELNANAFYRKFLKPIVLDHTVNHLPNMRGSGAVRDLHEACMLSPALKALLIKYVYAQPRIQEQMLDELIKQWAATAEFKHVEQRIAELATASNRIAFTYSWGNQTPNASQLEQQLLFENVKALEAFNNAAFFKFSSYETVSDGKGLLVITVQAGAITSLVQRPFEGAGQTHYLDETHFKLAPQQTHFIRQAYMALRQSIAGALAREIRRLRINPTQDSDDTFAHFKSEALLLAVL